ncbi:hypothetical protein CSUNSWCD_931 [Campylobacter showae CSUNSWCD]|uniref:Uncharacterized protein n=1 Tax=Campylobacter showae CSUNSWCD TaxID=1244083 RepID=M5IQ78_9BACT|nr:hypothetical protein CSUNSWCD_931 [Campylobacter showae CSUNSWCD]
MSETKFPNFALCLFKSFCVFWYLLLNRLKFKYFYCYPL